MEWLLLIGGFSAGLIIGYLLWNKQRSQELLQNEVIFMYVIQDTHEPVPYSIVVGEVQDGEGHVVSGAALSIEVVSDNPDAVEVVGGGDTGTLNFGAPGLANVTATVKSGGTVLAAGSASFTVTVGDVASVASVSLRFEGLTEV